MSPRLEVLNPLSFPKWDEIVLRNQRASFFHTTSWARVLCEAYQYAPVYFTAIKGAELKTLVPMMDVNSCLTGRRGVSLPFSDKVELIAEEEKDNPWVIDRIIHHGEKVGWRSAAWRDGTGFSDDVQPSSTHYVHSLDLQGNEKDLLAGLRSSTRRNINTAVNAGVTTEVSTSLEAVRTFYRLNCVTRKRHGVPPQPFSFFKKVYEHILQQDRGCVVLAGYKKRAIAGAVFFHAGRKAIYKYGASEERFLHLRPNNLVMWEGIRHYAARGFYALSLGRTEPDHEGLLQFKRGWGAREETVRYYKYDFGKERFVKDRSNLNSVNKLAGKMPLPWLILLGRVLYRHVA